MFRLISLLGLVAIVTAVVWAMRSQLIQFAGTKQTLRQESLALSNDFRQWRTLSATARVRALMRFFYLATLISVLLLALTGFLPVIFGRTVSNFGLFLHFVLAPLFAIGLTALALFWAQRHRFDQGDWEGLRRWLRKEDAGVAKVYPNVWQKISFWLSLLLAVPLIVSTVLMMYPLYGSAGQDWLLHLHGYTGLLLLIVVVWHTYSILTKRL